jgi:hypothetical protein
LQIISKPKTQEITTLTEETINSEKLELYFGKENENREITGIKFGNEVYKFPKPEEIEEEYKEQKGYLYKLQNLLKNENNLIATYSFKYQRYDKSGNKYFMPLSFPTLDVQKNEFIFYSKGSRFKGIVSLRNNPNGFGQEYYSVNLNPEENIIDDENTGKEEEDPNNIFLIKRDPKNQFLKNNALELFEAIKDHGSSGDKLKVIYYYSFNLNFKSDSYQNQKLILRIIKVLKYEDDWPSDDENYNKPPVDNVPKDDSHNFSEVIMDSKVVLLFLVPSILFLGFVGLGIFIILRHRRLH